MSVLVNPLSAGVSTTGIAPPMYVPITGMKTDTKLPNSDMAMAIPEPKNALIDPTSLPADYLTDSHGDSTT